ncbi:hypothetical protein PaecuDRAFT_1799 [Paenibacillus curdlanolyticus YK9]|uniref:Uncharacterized protein n=1 Tax=Paenibacillus curdlanolyticus YK9 TaxID=717606 RepID=E0I848_9BACL|nr:hypothetical protein [Paenibacillus curdlanolyticus]EFM11353.1 hypothetical protein PaecuDRAFT_1799 [Paenibacillus curdlanolyticus YK9]
MNVKHSTMLELFIQHRRGETLEARSIRDLELHKLDIAQPSDLIANSPVLQRLVRKHWQSMIVPLLRK